MARTLVLATLRRALEDFRNALRSDGPPTVEAASEAATPDDPDRRSAPAPLQAPEASAREIVGSAAELRPGETSAAASVGALRTVDDVPRGTGVPRWWLVAAGALALMSLAIFRWAPWTPGEPADPDVIATYQGGTVSRAQLQQQLDLVPETERGLYRSPEGLRALIGDVVIHEVTRRWAEERQVDQRKSFKDAMKHATEEIQIADVQDQLHQGRIQVGEAEIQAYYERNRARFGERPLVEVKDAIRRALVEEKEGAFVAQYLKDLKERASLQIDDGLLAVPEPSESELAARYQTSGDQLRVPEQATVAQIQVSLSLAGGDGQAKGKAETARSRAAAGEDFAQLARELSDGPEKTRGGELAAPVARGSRGAEFDAAVFTLQQGAISGVLREGDSYYVVKLLGRSPERYRPYAEVRAEIASTLRAERAQQLYAERRDRTLFTIHGRRTTLGEFLQELEELSPEQRGEYATPEGKRQLLGAFIERLLVVEDAAEQASDIKRRDDIDHARSDLLAQLLHKEQVDEQLKVSETEVQAEYERDRGRYTDPPQVKVRYIRVTRGRTADADRPAEAKIREAERKAKGRGGLFGIGGEPPSDFAELAKQYSEDPETAASGGLVDRWLSEGTDPVSEMFDHALHRALLPLKVGGLSAVLPLGDSYYLFQIAEKQEARPRSFEEAKPAVRKTLEARKHEELTASMERALLDRMQLRIYDSRVNQFAAELAPSSAAPR